MNLKQFGEYKDFVINIDMDAGEFSAISKGKRNKVYKNYEKLKDLYTAIDDDENKIFTCGICKHKNHCSKTVTLAENSNIFDKNLAGEKEEIIHVLRIAISSCSFGARQTKEVL